MSEEDRERTAELLSAGLFSARKQVSRQQQHLGITHASSPAAPCVSLVELCVTSDISLYPACSLVLNVRRVRISQRARGRVDGVFNRTSGEKAEE